MSLMLRDLVSQRNSNVFDFISITPMCLVYLRSPGNMCRTHFYGRDHDLSTSPRCSKKGSIMPFIFSGTFELWRKEQHSRLFCKCQRFLKVHLRKDEFVLVDILWCPFHSVYWKKISGKEREGKQMGPSDREEPYRFLLPWLLRAASKPAEKKEQGMSLASWVIHVVSSLLSNIPHPSAMQTDLRCHNTRKVRLGE